MMETAPSLIYLWRTLHAEPRQPMPALKNQRRELFCQHIARSPKTGLSATACYLQAGYRAAGHGAEVAASRLLSDVEVQERIAEINAPVVRKSRVTVQSLIDDLDTIVAGAAGDRQWGAAGAATTTKAKIAGLLRERLEIQGVNDFPDCRTPRDVVLALIDEYSGDARAVLELLERMCGLVEDVIASQATPVFSPPQPVLRAGQGTS